MNDLTILVCDYNTPDLIENLIKSIRNTCENVPDIFVMETGDPNNEVQIHPYVTHYGYPNSPHGLAVNEALENLIHTKYVLLIDSDVLFLKDFKKPFEIFRENKFTLMGEVVGDRGGKLLHPRVNPWYCFINLEDLRKHDICFYDKERSEASKRKLMNPPRIYDIGSTMYEDVLNAGLLIGDVRMENKYFKHYEGMSWRIQKYNPDAEDTDIDLGGTHPNRDLFLYGQQIREQYEKDVKGLYQ